MFRFLLILFCISLLALGAVRLVAYLSFDFSEPSTSNTRIDTVMEDIRVSFSPDGIPVVEAHSEYDAYVALGYVHGKSAAWQMALWRQSASGRLSEWFGEEMIETDRVALTLGMASWARESFAILSQAEQSILTGYSEGVNTAFRERRIALGDVVSLLDVSLAPWEPWHALLIERLLAWLSIDPEIAGNPQSISAGQQEAFAVLRRPLADWLHIYGVDNSAIWVIPDAADAELGLRYVYGASALPLVEPAHLSWPGTSFLGVFVPGWPAPINGVTEKHAWALVPFGRVTGLHAAASPGERVLRYDRIVIQPGGDEILVTTTGAEQALVFHESDSTEFRLGWSGFSSVSDFAHLRGCIRGNCGAFELTQPYGAILTAEGELSLIGDQQHVKNEGRRRVMTAMSYLSFLDANWLSVDAESEENGSPELYSSFAASLLPLLLDHINIGESVAPQTSDAVTFLRNWDYKFDGSSIGASIFDIWLGELGGFERSGNLSAQSAQQIFDGLERGLRKLHQSHGPDMSTWRWENTQPSDRSYPVWGAKGSGQLSQLPPAAERFKPFSLPSQGHPTTISYAASHMQGANASPSFWRATLTPGPDAFISIRNSQPSSDGFLGRFRLETESLPIVLALDHAGGNRSFTIRPQTN